MNDEPDEEVAARVRAALAYCSWRMSRSQVAEAMGLSVRTLSRMTQRPPVRRPTEPELDRLAELSGLPGAFMRHGAMSDIVALDEQGNLVFNDLTIGGGEFLVAVLKSLVQRWVREDPALLAGYGPTTELLEPSPTSPGAAPTRTSERSSRGREGPPRAGGRRRVA